MFHLVIQLFVYLFHLLYQIIRFWWAKTHLILVDSTAASIVVLGRQDEKRNVGRGKKRGNK